MKHFYKGQKVNIKKIQFLTYKNDQKIGNDKQILLTNSTNHKFCLSYIVQLLIKTLKNNWLIKNISFLYNKT